MTYQWDAADHRDADDPGVLDHYDLPDADATTAQVANALRDAFDSGAEYGVEVEQQTTYNVQQDLDTLREALGQLGRMALDALHQARYCGDDSGLLAVVHYAGEVAIDHLDPWEHLGTQAPTLPPILL